MAKNYKKLLEQALLHDGEMSRGLFEYELADQIDDFILSMKKDKEDYIFAVTENHGSIAMILVEKTGIVYANEDAREKLKALWPAAYEMNLKAMIPALAKELQQGYFSITGVSVKK